MAIIDPHSYTDPSQGTIRHIDLEWEVDFEAKRLYGSATLRFHDARDGILDLDTRALTIHEVTDLQGEALQWSLAPEESFMGAKLSIQRPQAMDALTLRFETSPEASALQWLEPSHTAGKAHPFLFSQCQAIHARALLPLQDSPRVRFTYQAKVKIPAALSAVMSAAPGTSEIQGEVKVQTFSMPQPIPSYLLAIAVGNLAEKEVGPRSTAYAEPETLDAAVWEFSEVDKMLESAEALFGDYLWERFDFVVMPPAFPYGGMENPRLTFLTPTLITGDRSLVNVLAHELAHSWTGNLVTNATNNDFWLNEGFTVWAERRILENLEGVEAAALASTIGRRDLEQELKRFGHDSPLTRLETDLEGIDPDEAFSSVPYEKGYLFVKLLEDHVGRERFDTFIQAYMKRFQFTSITTGEFEAFLEEHFPGIKDAVDAEPWLRGPGLPANAPTFSSAILERILVRVAKWEEKLDLDADAIDAWTYPEKLIFLQKLQRPQSQEACAKLDEALSLTTSNNAEILCEWLDISLRSSYAPATPKARAFLHEVGRMKFLKPLYNALKDVDLELAKEIFATANQGYHPIARAGLASLLGL